MSSRKGTSSRSTSRRRAWAGGDAGVYCLVLRLTRPRVIAAGALGRRRLPAGWYVYTGSAERGLHARLARHRRRVKPLHWHVDHLRAVARLHAIWVWPWSPGVECRTQARMRGLNGASIPWEGFGSSDCACAAHLTAVAAVPALYETGAVPYGALRGRLRRPLRRNTGGSARGTETGPQQDAVRMSCCRDIPCKAAGQV